MRQVTRPGAGAPPLVAAVVSPEERSKVEAASSGWFDVVHRDTLSDVIRAVRERPVDAVLLSVHQCRGASLDPLDHLTHDFPGLPTVALVSHADPHGSETLLHFGASGVRQVVDVSSPSGWQRLRQVLGHPVGRDAARIQAPVLAALGEPPPDTRLFFEAMIRLAPEVVTVRAFAERVQVRCTTLMSRFARAALPSPKSYLAAVRLLHATLQFESQGLTVADVAYRLEFSSPQSFGRHVRALLGVSTSEFRRRFPFPVALERFIGVMITPYAETWRWFRPLVGALGEAKLG
jgi:AraC-like DNA-binding protein